MAYKSSEVAILSRPKKNTTGAAIKRGSAVKLSAAVYDEIALCNAPPTCSTAWRATTSLTRKVARSA
jgi:hypothetical protein